MEGGAELKSRKKYNHSPYDTKLLDTTLGKEAGLL